MNNEIWHRQNNQTIVLVESYNVKILNTILKNWTHPYLQGILHKDVDDPEKIKILFNHLKKYVKGSVIETDQQTAKYNSVYTQSGKSINKIGRYFVKSSIGLQHFKKVIRETITQGYYHDIDMVNCHPNILYQYCIKNRIEIVQDGSFSKYINNRDSVFLDLIDKSKNTIDRNSLKTTFLVIMNGGEYRKMDIPEIDAFFEDEVEEMKSILEQVSNLNPHIKPSRKDENELASITNKVIVDIENSILYHAFNFLINNNEYPSVLCFDGIMISAIHPISEVEMKLEKLSNHIKDSTSYDMKFKIKPYENVFDVSKIIDGTRYTQDKVKFEKLFLAINRDELGTSDLFYDLYGKDNIKIVSLKPLLFYVWNPKNKLWIKYNCKDVLLKTISDIILSYSFDALKGSLLSEEDEKRVKSFRLKICTSRYTSSIFKYISNTCFEPNFLNNVNSSTNILPIKNGLKIYLKTGECFEREISDYFSYELDVDITDDEKQIREIEQFMFELMNNDIDELHHIQSILGYCITGENRLKLFQIWYGSGNNGKSTLSSLIMNVMQEYSTSVCHTIVSKLSTKKAGRANPELVALKGRHIGFINENSNDQELNSESIKAIASGGMDTLTTRQLFQEQETFIPKIKMIMSCNNKPTFDISDKALISRIRFIPFQARFEVNKENCEKVEYIKTLKNAFFLWLVKGAIMYYKNGDILPPTRKQTDMLNETILENDTVGQFIEERYELGDDYKMPYRDFFDSYNFIHKIKTTDLKAKLISKGFKIVKNSIILLRGIRPKITRMVFEEAYEI